MFSWRIIRTMLFASVCVEWSAEWHRRPITHARHIIVTPCPLAYAAQMTHVQMNSFLAKIMRK